MENIKRINEKTVEIDGQVYRLDEPCKNMAEEKQSNRFKPSMGEVYHCINFGRVEHFVCGTDYIDKSMFAIGNCFKTKEEAEFMVEKLKVLAELSEFTEKNREWDGKNKHYTFCYNGHTNEFAIDEWVNLRTLGLHFESVEIMKQAIATVGEDRIKKYLFEVE